MKSLAYTGKTLFILLIVSGYNLLFFVEATAQPYFVRSTNVPVIKSSASLKNPWAGGINFGQFSAIDLNLDGTKDLFVFDRSGNNILTFINNGTSDSVDYIHAPQYQSKFPALHDWALLVDYNCDGKEDIFSCSNAGFCVWKNTSDFINGLQFTLDSANMYTDGYWWRVASDYGSGTYNLYVSSVDIPAIADIDNDGDIDVLTFALLGTTVEFHQNLSMDHYGTCDSLTFELVTQCWGNFYENQLDNTVVYPATCKTGISSPPVENSETSLHTGSTFLAFDNDCDIDLELVMGDVSFNNLVFVLNGGTASSAIITGHDYNFPSYDIPADVRIFPAAFFLDLNNDSLRDLVVCPNAKNVSENFTSVWYYENTGTDCSPYFSFRKNNLFQDEMVEFGEGSYPVFFDFDADGLTDILAGNYGYYATGGYYPSKIAALKNTGTLASPQFEFVNDDYSGLSAYGLSNIYPALGDLDGDGDADLLLGERGGYLVHFENTAGSGNPANFQFVQTNYQSIDIGDFATPQIIDLDRDGNNDLVIGEKSGNICYYRNTGTSTNPIFTKITDSLGKVRTLSQGYIFGYSAPFFYDDSGDYKLICGSEGGYLFYYENIDGNLTGTFSLVTAAIGNIREGYRTALNCTDLNSDGFMDMVVGNYGGGLALYFGDTLITGNNNILNPTVGVIVYPVPAAGEIKIVLPSSCAGSKIKAALYDYSGKRVYFQETYCSPANSSSGVADVVLIMTGINPGMYLCRIDADGEQYHARVVYLPQ